MMSTSTFIHEHLHLGTARGDRRDRRTPRRSRRPDLMITVLATALLIVLAISVIRVFGWFGTAGAFLLTVAASAAIVRMVRGMVADDRD